MVVNLTQKADNSTEESSRLENRSDIARYFTGRVVGNIEGSLEAWSRKGCSYKSTIVTEPKNKVYKH